MNNSTLDAKLSHLSAETKSFASDLRGWVRNGVNRVTGADRRALAERFTAWINKDTESDATAGPDPDMAELRSWINELDQQGHEALTEQLCDFCEAFEIELAWLVDGELAQWPELEATLGEMALRYCLACKAAVDADAQLQKFRHRRVWKRRIKGLAQDGQGKPSEQQR